MNDWIQRLLVLGVLFLPACSLPFGYSIEPEGGLDQLDGDDQIIMRAKRIKGLGGGANALVIPAGWKDLPRTEDGSGTFETVPEVSFRWLSGQENLPRLPVNRKGRLAYPLTWNGESGLWFGVRRMDQGRGTPFKEHSPESHHPDFIERLKNGEDAYVLVPRKDGINWADLRYGFTVYGAVGPPLEWIRLGVVELESSDAGFSKFLSMTVGTLAWSLDCGFAGVGYLVAISLFPFGGGIAFTQNRGKLLPHRPW